MPRATPQVDPLLETVLRLAEPEREEGVGLARGVDVRNAVAIEVDAHGAFYTGHRKRPRGACLRHFPGRTRAQRGRHPEPGDSRADQGAHRDDPAIAQQPDQMVSAPSARGYHVWDFGRSGRLGK